MEAARFLAGMAFFTGRLQGLRLEPTPVTVEIDEGRFRMAAGRRHLGSWPLDDVEVQRASIYRFAFEIDGDRFEFLPDDPRGFSDAAGAVIDLTEAKGRYGLKARIEQAAKS